MNDKLELLALSEKFSVVKKDDGFEIECVNDTLAAFISKDNEITYYVTGCYDSGSDWIEFDIKELEELKKFCELMVK